MLHKVLMLLTNAFMPDPRVYQEAASLVKNGYAVKILCWDRGENLPENEVIDGIEIERIRIRSVHSRGTSQVIFLLLLWLKMLWCSTKEKFDIVYCHDFDTLPVGLLIKALYKRVVIFDSHDVFSKSLSKSVFKPLISIIAFME